MYFDFNNTTVFIYPAGSKDFPVHVLVYTHVDPF